MGLVAMLSQVGYAAGLLLFVPLGDRLERRSFILVMLGAVTVALLGVAAAPSFAWLAAASLAVGRHHDHAAVARPVRRPPGRARRSGAGWWGRS